MKITLKPTPKQHQAYQKLQDKTTKYLLFGGGAGGGKSWLGCENLIILSELYPGTRWFIGREELKRITQSTLITFSKVLKNHNIPYDYWKLNGQYNYLENTQTGSRIDLLDLKHLPADPLYERFGSLEYTGGWIEEAGEVNFKAFDVLKSRIGRHLNKEYSLLPKLLITSNPKKNWLYSTFYKPYKNNELPPKYAFIQSLYRDNPHTAEEYSKQLEEITDKATKERLMFGNWEYDDDPSALIEYDAITDLYTNKPDDGEKYISADIARQGSDKIVIYVWNGLTVEKIITKQKQGTNVTAKDIKKLEELHKVPRSHVIIDEDGIGGGVVDQLPGCKGFIAQTKPFKDENYQNLKAQCTYLLAKKINARELAVKTDDSEIKELLTEELEQIKSKDTDKDGKLNIQPKDKIKEIIGRSPDYADALMMRMYFCFKSKPKITFI